MVTATATSKPPPVPCCSTCTPLCPFLYVYAYTLGATTINGNLQVNGTSIATNCCCIIDDNLGRTPRCSLVSISIRPAPRLSLVAPLPPHACFMMIIDQTGNIDYTGTLNGVRRRLLDELEGEAPILIIRPCC